MNAQPSCETLLQQLAQTFNREAAGELQAVIQFIFTGEESASCTLTIGGGKCIVQKGEADFPRLTIRVDAGVWREIMSGQLSWSEAMMQRKFVATGNFPLLARLPQLFKIG